MRNLALHQITMMKDGPAGLVRFAAKAGLRSICLFTQSPTAADGSNMFPVVEAKDKAAFRALLADHDVTVLNAEYFPIMADADVSSYLPAIGLAGELGAKRIVTHVQDSDPIRAEDQLDSLCRLAADHGLDVGLEFTGFAKGCNNIDKAVSLVGKLQQPNLNIAVDALHLFRTGGSLQKLAAVDPALIGYAQICDGPDFRISDDYVEEAMNRMIPGAGVFPLREFLALLSAEVDLDIEVPQFSGGAAFDPEQWALDAIAASRSLFE